MLQIYAISVLVINGNLGIDVRPKKIYRWNWCILLVNNGEILLK